MRRARLQAVRGAGSLAMQARPAGAHGHQMLRREAERRVRGPVLQGAAARGFVLANFCATSRARFVRHSRCDLALHS